MDSEASEGPGRDSCRCATSEREGNYSFQESFSYSKLTVKDLFSFKNVFRRMSLRALAPAASSLGCGRETVLGDSLTSRQSDARIVGYSLLLGFR